MAEERVHDADPRWAAEQAPRLLADARAEALQEARVRLRERLVDALMAAADASAPQGDVPAPQDDGGLVVWVYGVMDGDVLDLPRCAGVDGRHTAELIRHAGLAAIVSEVPRDEYEQGALETSLEDLERLEALARGHEQVLDEALTLGPVVPLRICTIYESADHVREMLERERRSLAHALDRLAGTAEWGVKAYLAAPAEVPVEAAVAATAATGTEYLARRHDARDAAQEAWRAADASVQFIHDRLSEHAVDAVLSRSQDRRLSGRTDEMVLNAAYLVPDARFAEFQTLFSDLARRHAPDGLVLELTGPWPPYHFAGPRAPE